MSFEIYKYDKHTEIQRGIIKHIEQSPLRSRYWNMIPQERPINEVVEIQNFFRTKLPDKDWYFYVVIFVATQGAKLDRHNHLAETAAVYHVEGEGDLIFENDGIDSRVPVVPGQLVVWPAHLMHRVDEVKSERRISVALHAKLYSYGG